MIKGSTVIFNEAYISEVERHKNIWQEKYEVENVPAEKEKAKANLTKLQQKLEWALDFTDTLDSVVNVDVPQLTVIKTMNGYELPAKHVQLV